MKSTRSIVFILSCIMIFNLFGCSLPSEDSSNENDKGNNTNDGSYVAKVAGEKITIPEFRYLLSYIMNSMEDEAGLEKASFLDKMGFWEKVETNQEEDNEALAKKEALKRLTQMKIIASKAREQSIVLDEKDIEEVKSYTKQYIAKIAEGNGELAEGIMLDELGMNFNQFEALNGELILTKKFRENMMQKIEISEDELLELYENNTEKYDAVLFEYILIMTETYPGEDPLTEDEIKEKRKLAEEVLQMAIDGEDFNALTRKYTEDPEYEFIGNQYAFVVEDAFGEVDLWAVSSQEGDYNMFEVPAGFLIVKTIKKFGFDDAKEIIKRDVRIIRFRDELEMWMSDEKYAVEINQPVFDLVGAQ